MFWWAGEVRRKGSKHAVLWPLGRWRHERNTVERQIGEVTDQPVRRGQMSILPLYVVACRCHVRHLLNLVVCGVRTCPQLVVLASDHILLCSVTMFAEELKTLRRLGFRHVGLHTPAFVVILRAQTFLASPPDTQLCIGHRIWLDAMERSGPLFQHRVAHRCRPEVRIST